MKLDIKNLDRKKYFKSRTKLKIMAIVLLVFTILAPKVSLASSKGPEINIHGNLIYSDVNPFIEKDRTMVPIRLIAENLGYEVEWEDAIRKVTISSNGKEIELFINKNYAVKNGKRESLDVAPLIRNDRTFVPIRYIAETFNQVVIWDNENKRVEITRQKDVPTEDEDYIGRFVLINDANLDKVNNLQVPQDLKVGDVGLILKADGNLLLVDLIKPQGDLPDDWSFARGYVPKDNTILNPRPNELKMISNVCRLINGEITLQDSVTGRNYTVAGNRFVNIVRVENNRVLIEVPGGNNDAWVSINDVDFGIEYFIGNPK